VTNLDRPARRLAVAVAGIAGFVDAVGYLASGGFFVSFMSGNSTRLGVGIAAETEAALMAGALIAGFVAGVTGGFLIARIGGRRRQAAVLTLVAIQLAVATGIGELTGSRVALIVLASAMGAVNAMFEQGGEVRIGLTYMTGTLVKIGHRLARALTGGDRWGWVPFAMLWGGLIAGGAIGAAAYLGFGLAVLWLPTGGATLLALITALRPIETT